VEKFPQTGIDEGHKNLMTYVIIHLKQIRYEK